MSDEAEDAAFIRACACLAARLEAGDALRPDLAVAALGLGARAYAAAVLRGSPVPPALPPEATATNVVIATSAMLRAAGLNRFYLAMWFNRIMPECERR
ncbi:hypothetical protein [Falsiroseomonas sp. HW251]|uniref:hypothetical protein n=1 Tax=Falsiroseomonas sp. HW251 TaxID=3390998 RepID=UPI003D3242C4